MKNAKSAMCLAVLGAAVCSSPAWAGFWSNQNFGTGKTDGGTKAIAQQQGNKWNQWFWQGKNEGMQVQCPSNNSAATCQKTFNIPSKSTSFSQGLNIQAGGFNQQELAALYNRQYSKTMSTRGSSMNVQAKKGQSGQPVAVQERRWTKGVFRGAHFKTQTRNANYFYEWAGRDFASWTDNQAVGNPYLTVVYTNGGGSTGGGTSAGGKTSTGGGSSAGAVRSGSGATSVNQAAGNTRVKFMPIHRNAEQDRRDNAQITDQASFGRAVDKVAREYGLDPNLFRAQMQAESGAMTNFRSAMRHNGDTNRGSNSSVGIGQISRNFLDGGPWSGGGPNNGRVGGRTVTSAEYNNSALIQLRVAAGNLAMRIQDHAGGRLDGGLRYYVSGHASADSQNQIYINNINRFMQDRNMMNIGR
jgi:hypothetical protein